MTIGIDCRMFHPSFGIGRYIQQLVTHLETMDRDNHYVLFFRKENWDAYMPSHANFRKVLADIPWYTWKEHVLFPQIIKKENVDLMHFPHWNVPYAYGGPFVVTMHDLTMFHYPRPEATTRGRIVFWIKDKAHRLLVRRVVKKAKHILTTSEYTKYDIHRTLGVPLRKMTTIYQVPFQSGVHARGRIQKISRITKPYVLYVGAAYPHKNLSRLIAAWRLCDACHPDAYQLVLAGRQDYFYKRLRAETRPPRSVVFTGFVSDEVLSVLYANARLFVFPSLYEGFGLPPLEAMVEGVPVVASSASCLPEILGDAALYVDPESVQALSECIDAGLTDEQIRSDLIQRAKRHVALFSGDRLARATRNVYETHARRSSDRFSAKS